MTSYIGDLERGGAQIASIRHFPLTDTSDAIAAWTVDSKSGILVSNRSGHFALYKQPLDGDTAAPLVPEGYGRDPKATPDGRSLIYLGPASDSNGGCCSQPQPLMQIGLNGGSARTLFIARPWTLLMCAHPPSQLCAVAEPSSDGKQAIVTAIDQEKGRGSELARYGIEPNENDWWTALSPDGSLLATTPSTAGPIKIISLRGQPSYEIALPAWGDVFSFAWAADQKGLFVTVGKRHDMTILYVDLKGKTFPLWQSLGTTGETLGVPSPDGRHLAMQTWTTSGNIWMLENF
jgi:hypothetical protein